MALPSSGQLSIDDIAVEFGGATPHGLTEYYAADDNIPTSGEIAITDFYGASNIPPPVARDFYDRYAHTSAPKGVQGTAGLLRAASVTTSGNYAGTTMRAVSQFSSAVYCDINANDQGQYLRWYNPAFWFRHSPSSWIGILDTDRLCRLEFKLRVGYGSGDVQGTTSHKTYGKLTSTAGNTTIDSRSSGSTSSGLVTYTTTQNLQWYLDNNEYVQFSIYAHSGNISNYNRTSGTGSCSISFEEINFVI